MEQDILSAVLAYFRKLAKIPRPSGYEKAISDYLVKEFQKLGCSVVQDKVLNVIADLPATAGCENAPLTILQSHMDMVCVAEDGVVFNPLEDAIKLKQTEEYLAAEGTSLGSDDGTGIAEILYIFNVLKVHGPLRAIITVDEEAGMTGAANLSPEYLADAKYLINCDSEDYDILTVGCAGSVSMDFSTPIKRQSLDEKGTTWRISVHGLKGGHSGERIGDGRANAIKIIGHILSRLMAHNYLSGIVELQGGVARNAIPADAEAEFVAKADKNQLEKIIKDEYVFFCKMFEGIEESIDISLHEAPAAKSIIERKQTENLLNLISLLHSGIFAMSNSIPGLVETSANLGIVCMDESEIKLAYFPRSSVAEKLTDIFQQGKILASLTGFCLNEAQPSPAWHEKRDSRLATMMTEIFAEQNNKPMQVNTIHAGLECGYHYLKNTQLDMVSVGVTTLDIHSPSERLVLSTVVPQVRLISETLKRIATE